MIEIINEFKKEFLHLDVVFSWRVTVPLFLRPGELGLSLLSPMDPLTPNLIGLIVSACLIVSISFAAIFLHDAKTSVPSFLSLTSSPSGFGKPFASHERPLAPLSCPN
jgi:hypothetical protein